MLDYILWKSIFYLKWEYAAAAKSRQSCPTLCGPIDGSPPGSPVPGILQARTLEWGAISFINAWKWKVIVKSLSRVRLLATPWTAVYRLLYAWDFPGKSNGVGCHCLFPRVCYQLPSLMFFLCYDLNGLYWLNSLILFFSVQRFVSFYFTYHAVMLFILHLSSMHSFIY